MFFAADAPLQQGVREGIPHPAHRQESLRHQQRILLPIHPPLIINLSDEQEEEDDGEDDEENCKQFFSFLYKEVQGVFPTLAMYFTTDLS